MNKIKMLITFVALVYATGCTTLPASPPEWSMQKEAIVMNIKADKELNKVKGKSYSLFIVIYQLSDPNPFNQLNEDQAGLQKLLEGKIFDPSVVNVKTRIVYPDSNMTYTFDRAQGARYIAVVAGYEVMEKERIVKLYDVPILVKEEFAFLSLEKSRILLPDHLKINLALGPRQIISEEDKKKEKEKD